MSEGLGSEHYDTYMCTFPLRCRSGRHALGLISSTRRELVPSQSNVYGLPVRNTNTHTQDSRRGEKYRGKAETRNKECLVLHFTTSLTTFNGS